MSRQPSGGYGGGFSGGIGEHPGVNDPMVGCTHRDSYGYGVGGGEGRMMLMSRRMTDSVLDLGDSQRR